VTTDFGLGDSALCVAIQNNGRIIVAGTSTGGDGIYVGTLARYNSNGSLDTTFNGTGKIVTQVAVTTAWGGVAIQRDGEIVVAGGSYNGNVLEFAVARYQGDLDTDHDGILDWYETGTGIYVSPEDTGTSPTNPDSDNDGLPDGMEVITYHTNPNLPDTDGDGFLDGYEVLTGHSPLDPLDHPAMVAEARTAIEFTFPSALGKTYTIEDSLDLTTWTTVESGIAGNGAVIQRFYSTRNMPKRYFRVEYDAP
jgi:uncharacterized delta-60 repeat protein